MEIKDSVAVVTGGASGLGEACVRNLVNRGGKVSIFDFAEDRGEKVASELGDAVIFCMTDITDEANVQAAVDKTIEVFGAIHIAVNCAGVGIPAKVLGKEGPMSMDHFNKVVQINLMGTMNVVRLAAEKMVKNQGNDDGEKGVVINVASVAAFDGQIGQAAYSASKAAVHMLTRSLAKGYARDGIRVNCICPAHIDTRIMDTTIDFFNSIGVKSDRAKIDSLYPLGRRGMPEDVASLAVFLVSEQSSWMTGSLIVLDGGATA